jgi:thiol-disulfide isomerase/thioredoxin
MLLACACKPGATSLPTWDDASGDEQHEQEGLAEVSMPGSANPEDSEEAPEPEAADGGAEAVGTSGGNTTAEPDAPVADAPAEEPAAAVALPAPLHKKIDKSCGKDDGVGERLKSFSLDTVDGKKVSQATYRGRVVLVNFWGTWCKPCKKELPEFDQLYRRYRKHGLTLLAIATDEDPDAVKDFKDEKKLAAKLAIGGEDYAGKYTSKQFPFTFVVDTKGVIKASYNGYKPECMGKLEDDIRRELGKRAGG